jgi:hypothetical protein
MPSVYLAQDYHEEGVDPRVLETKIHYLMNMMQKAGLLLDANGKPLIDVSDDVKADSDTVQQTLDGSDYYK